MSIIASEIKLLRSAVVNDTSTNGGGLSVNEVQSGANGNLFPNVTQAQRTAGITQYRKMFFKNANAANLTLFNSMVFQDSNTPAADSIVFWKGTKTDTQNNFASNGRKYGAGLLAANAAQNAVNLVITVENGAVPVFVSGDTIRITNKANPGDSGVEFFVACTGILGTSGNDVTIATDPIPSAITAGYKVASGCPTGDLVASATVSVVTSAAGLVTDAQRVFDNPSCIDQTWTITFSNPTTFSCAGSTVGSVGSGGTGSTFQPNNPDFGVPYFRLPANFWAGTWQAGDTVVFTASSASVPLWFKHVVPASTPAWNANSSVFIMNGESP